MATVIYTVCVSENIYVPEVAADGQVAHHLADGVAVVGLDAYYTAQPLQRLAYARPGIPTRPLAPKK